jgi:hypothetical protein
MVNEEISFRIKMPRTVMAFEQTLGPMLGQLVLEPELSCRKDDEILTAASKGAYVGL